MRATLRFATPDDARAISALIVDLQPFLTIAPDGAGAEQFMATVQPEIIAANLRADNYRYQLALQGTALAGVVAVRDNAHLFNLYVAKQFHGHGLGRQLWEAARDDALERGNAGSFTVNSSAYAEQVYRRWGFEPTAPVQEQHGLRYIPMRLGAASA
jgi:GNAT superfamily N-acetyltransferase